MGFGCLSRPGFYSSVLPFLVLAASLDRSGPAIIMNGSDGVNEPRCERRFKSYESVTVCAAVGVLVPQGLVAATLKV